MGVYSDYIMREIIYRLVSSSFAKKRGKYMQLTLEEKVKKIQPLIKSLTNINDLSIYTLFGLFEYLENDIEEINDI